MKLPTRAHSFQIHFCQDPLCGPHIIAFDDGGLQICEIVMSPKQAIGAMKEMQLGLYEKVTRRLE